MYSIPQCGVLSIVELNIVSRGTASTTLPIVFQDCWDPSGLIVRDKLPSISAVY